MLIPACGDSALRDEAALKNEPQAIQRLDQINRILVGSKTITPDDFNYVKELHGRFPNAALIRSVMKNALIARSDWQGLLDFLGPAEELTGEDKIIAASALFKMGEFAAALKLTEDLVSTDPGNIEAVSISARCHYSLGNSPATISLFSPISTRLEQEKRKDDLTLLGLALLDIDRTDDAIAAFRSAFDIDPNDPSSANGLSRAYYVKGDTNRAEEFRKRTDAAQERLSAMELRGRAFVQQSYRLEAAWKERNYSEVVRLAREMLPNADDKNKAALYQYLIESYKALGRNSEADLALEEARRILRQ